MHAVALPRSMEFAGGRPAGRPANRRLLHSDRTVAMIRRRRPAIIHHSTQLAEFTVCNGRGTPLIHACIIPIDFNL